jgi:UDP-glucose 4-epimerase
VSLSKILVVGGSGFIGSHLIKHLSGSGFEVANLDRNIPRLALPTSQRVTFIEGDVFQFNWKQFKELESFDTLFYLVGTGSVPISVQDPFNDFELNLSSVIRLLNELRMRNWPGKLVYSSSAAVYGNLSHIPIKETDPANPISPYGVSKLAVERYLTVFCKLYGLKAAALRNFSVFGPFQRKLVVYDLMVKIAKRTNPLVILGDGTQTRDFIYIEDVVHAFQKVAENGHLTGETYNCASGVSCLINNLAVSLLEIFDYHPEIMYTGNLRPGDPQNLVGDISQLKQIGFEPKTSLRQGLQKTVDWFLNNYD